MAESTFYTTVSDGTCYTYDPDWDTVHDAALGFVSTQGIVVINVGVAYIGGIGIWVHRAFFYFDTSSIGSGSTITAAVLHLYSSSAPVLSGATEWHVVEGVQDDPLTQGDYGDHLLKTTSGGGIASGSWTDTGYNAITLNATGRGWISKTGTTKLCIREKNHDIDDSTSGTSIYYCSLLPRESGLYTSAKLVVTYDLVSYTVPVVRTDAADDLKQTTATLNGTLLDDGGAPAEAMLCGFDWGRTAAYGNYTGTAAGYQTNDPFDAALTGLLPGTEYHFRAKGINSAGTGYGDDATFTTKSAIENDGGVPDDMVVTQGFVSAIRRHIRKDATNSEGGVYTIEVGLGGFGAGITSFVSLDRTDQSPIPSPDFYKTRLADIYSQIDAALYGSGLTRPQLQQQVQMLQDLPALLYGIDVLPAPSDITPHGEEMSPSIRDLHKYRWRYPTAFWDTREKRLARLENMSDGVPATTAEAILKTLFDANTILKADADNVPEALTVAEQRLVGRITSGEITALTAAQVKTLLAIDHGADLAGLTDVADHAYALLHDGTRALSGAWDMGSQALTNVNIDSGVITGITDLAVADGGTGASSAGAARTNLGLVIGTDILAYDAGLQNLAGVAMAANKMYYTSGDNVHVATDLTAFGRTWLAYANAATGIAGLSGTAGAAFAWNSQNLTGIGTLASGGIAVTTTGAVDVFTTTADHAGANVVFTNTNDASVYGTTFRFKHLRATPSNFDIAVDLAADVNNSTPAEIVLGRYFIRGSNLIATSEDVSHQWRGYSDGVANNLLGELQDEGNFWIDNDLDVDGDVTFGGNMFAAGLKSGANQGAAGAAANELWVDTADQTVKRGT